MERGQRELHREDGRLQWNDVSVSNTRKTGDCNAGRQRERTPCCLLFMGCEQTTKNTN